MAWSKNPGDLFFMKKDDSKQVESCFSLNLSSVLTILIQINKSQADAISFFELLDGRGPKGGQPPIKVRLGSDVGKVTLGPERGNGDVGLGRSLGFAV